jgi:hypothetical protein
MNQQPAVDVSRARSGSLRLTAGSGNFSGLSSPRLLSSSEAAELQRRAAKYTSPYFQV